jgi:hypothetical protein
MSKIQISNLQPAGTELFQVGESFLVALESIEAHQILGGKKSKKGGSKKSGSKKSGSRKSYRTPVHPPYMYLPYYCPPPPCGCGGSLMP